jgi:type II secretory pathway pseudopilin PulG
MLVSHKFRRHREPRRDESGYLLLTLLLFITMLVIASAAIAPDIATEVKRQREEEMIHRGVQYSRAIQHYYKKFNRYPNTIEELQNTNNMRFLRKRYKDPITGKDFRLLHYGDVQMIGQGGLIGPGVTGANGQPFAAQGTGQPFGGNSPFSNQNNPFGQQSSPFAAQSTTVFGSQQENPFGGNQNGAFGNSPAMGQNSNPTQPGQAGADQQQSGNQGDNASKNQSAGDSESGDQKVYGGGPIVGVASTSKKDSVREFNKKHHYNEWQFTYDPSLDRGGLIKGPTVPPIAGAAPVMQGAQPAGAQPGANQSPFGGNQQSPFGGSPAPAPQQQQQNPSVPQ